MMLCLLLVSAVTGLCVLFGEMGRNSVSAGEAFSTAADTSENINVCRICKST